jgi:hypothetical protein
MKTVISILGPGPPTPALPHKGGGRKASRRILLPSPLGEGLGVGGPLAMRPGGRLQRQSRCWRRFSTRHRPAPDALKEWGRAHRFAGAGDRAAIGNLVFDALRGRAFYATLMESDAPRALALARYAGSGA